jgi:lipoate-protein ligase A
MGSWRYLTAAAVSAPDGLAADEALMRAYQRNQSSDFDATLRLYTYRSHCALIGRFQNLDDEVDLDACRARGLQYGRRPTGGGTIIMGEDQLGVAVCTRAPGGIAPRDLLRLYSDAVLIGLERLGIRATFRPKADLEVQGRKIGGMGIYIDDRGALLFHASILADLDIPLMLQVLKIPGATGNERGADRVAERMTSVTQELGRKTTGLDIRDEIHDAFAEALGIDLQLGALDEHELEVSRELVADKYASESWIRQRSPEPNAFGSASLKTPAGFVRVYVGVREETIRSILVTGDFNTQPRGVAQLEAGLKWSRLDHDRIAAVCEKALDSDELGVKPPLIAHAIVQAATRAMERDRQAHPVRPTGSCYYPEDAADN